MAGAVSFFLGGVVERVALEVRFGWVLERGLRLKGIFTLFIV